MARLSRRGRLHHRARIEAAEHAGIVMPPPNAWLRDLLTRAVRDIPEADAGSVSWVARHALVAAVIGESIKGYEGARIALPNTMCAAVVSVDAPVYAPDVDEQPLLSGCLVKADFPGYAGHPIHFRGHVVGAVAVFAARNRLPVRAMDVLAVSASEIEQYMALREP